MQNFLRRTSSRQTALHAPAAWAVVCLVWIMACTLSARAQTSANTPATIDPPSDSAVSGAQASAPQILSVEHDPRPLPDVPSVPAQHSVVAEGLDPDGKVFLAVNHSRTLITSARLRNADQIGAAITEGSADIATVTPISPTSILITAKKPGSTDLTIEDETGQRQTVSLFVGADLQALRQQLQSLSKQADINITDDNGELVMRGHVPTLKIAEEAAEIAGAYYGGGTKVANLLEVSGGQQVMLQVKFAEVSKSVQTQLGVNFGYSDGTTFFGNNTGQVTPFAISGSTLQNAALAAVSPSGAVQLFGNGSFGRSAFAYFINALRQNQLMRTLAEPNLTAISGETASFQVGGEIPVPVPQGGGGGSTSAVITIQYENYGVILHFTPVVLGDGHIRLKIDPEVSDLDYAHGVTIGGFVVPGFTIRTVDTTVELGDGQTFTIAGLLNDQVTASNTSIPALGDLPILGALFRSVEYQRNQTELVVMVTPHLVEAVNPDQVVAGPGEHWRYPSEADLFLARDLGGEAVQKTGAETKPTQAAGPAPQFRGQYGFVPTSDTLVVEP
jgi:pilus assembly protein CpaC